MPSNMTTTKPGFRSSEFWLSTAAMLLGIVLASGALEDGGMVAQIVGGALAILARLGYDAGRAHVKASTAKAQAVTALAMRGAQEPGPGPSSAPDSTLSSGGEVMEAWKSAHISTPPAGGALSASRPDALR